MEDLFSLLRIDSQSAKGKGAEAAKFLVDYMKNKGIEAEEIRHKSVNPYVVGELNVGAAKTLLIYNHYDIQPVEPLERWETDPLTPTIKEGKVIARGVADDKGALMARLESVISLYKEGKLKVNLKFLYEGEEEIGSPYMASFLTDNAKRLKANYVLWEGAGKGPNGAPQIVLGVKGLLYVEIRTETPKDLHSMYAPVARNPVWELLNFLNELRGEDGKVKIPGFYDDVVVPPSVEGLYASKLGIDMKTVERALGYRVGDDFLVKLVRDPTCNIDGIQAGYVGEGSKTVIPSSAFVKIDFRLVPRQRAKDLLAKLREMVDRKGFKMMVLGEVEPFRTCEDSEISKALIESAKETYFVEPLVLPNSPGTGPMASVSNMLGIRQIADGVGPDNPESNIHSFNEFIYKRDYDLCKEWMTNFLRRLGSQA